MWDMVKYQGVEEQSESWWRGGLSMSGKLQEIKIRVQSRYVQEKRLEMPVEGWKAKEEEYKGCICGELHRQREVRGPHLHTPHCRCPWPSLQWGARSWVSLQLQSHSVCNSTISSSEKPRARNLRKWGSGRQRVAWKVTKKFTCGQKSD